MVFLDRRISNPHRFRETELTAEQAKSKRINRIMANWQIVPHWRSFKAFFLDFKNRAKTKCFKRSEKDQDQAKCQADSNQEDSVFVRFETLRLWCFVTVLFCWTVILCYFVIFFFVTLLLCDTLFLCYFVTAYGTQCLWNLENCDEDA